MLKLSNILRYKVTLTFLDEPKQHSVNKPLMLPLGVYSDKVGVSCWCIKTHEFKVWMCSTVFPLFCIAGKRTDMLLILCKFSFMLLDWILRTDSDNIQYIYIFQSITQPACLPKLKKRKQILLNLHHETW